MGGGMKPGSDGPTKTPPTDWSKRIPKADRIGPDEFQALVDEAKRRGEPLTQYSKYLAISMVDNLLDEIEKEEAS